MGIEVKNLIKSFDKKVILDDISFKVDDGKILSIVGFSGSGKSTVLKLISGLIEKDSGEINTSGGDIAMVFQYSALFDSLNVFDNISFALQERKDLRGKYTRKELEKIVAEKLELVGLSGIEEQFPSELSGGMQKRVAIARAIALNPQYLFCDEPNSGLDPKTSLVIDELIQDITREYNMTTLINTHDMNSVMGIGEKIIYIYEGHKEWEGNKDDIFTSTNERLNSFIFASDLFRKVKEVEIQNLEG